MIILLPNAGGVREKNWVPGLGEAEAGGSVVQSSLSNRKTSFQNERGRETRTKTLGKRKLICKRGEGVICLELNGCPDSAKCSDKGQLK